MAAAAAVRRVQGTTESMAAEGILASGKMAEKLSLPNLQSKMKCDPEGYESELSLIYSQFKSLVELFNQQASLNFTSLSGVAADPTVAKDLGDRVMFLAHVTPFYPKQLAQFPRELAQFLRSSARSLPSSLRVNVAQALILMINRNMVDIRETLELFMELQTLVDKDLRKMAFSHVIHSIRRMNQKHKNDKKNRELQSILYTMLQQEDELKAKQALITLCELYRRKVWFDERTANAICIASFHSSSRVMIASLSFLIDYEKTEGDDDSDNSDSEDDNNTQQPHVVVNKEAIYKANNKGTTASKKKKKAKLQRVIRNLKKKQRLESENNDNSNYNSPLSYLKDPQGFAEKLFSRLQTCNVSFKHKMMMMKVTARAIGLHHLILLKFYPHLQNYVKPHQSNVTTILAAAVQACHDMVPPDAIEPLFRQIVYQFVNDRSRPEAISVGLNVVREICMRVPLLMTEDLLQDLVLYKKSNQKAVSSAARSLVTLFREICPSLLVKKDRGRPSDPKARPKAFGEVHVASNVPGIELLDEDDEESDDDDVESGSLGSFNNGNESGDDVESGPIGSDEDVFPVEEEESSEDDAFSVYSDDLETDDENFSDNADTGDQEEDEEMRDDDDGKKGQKRKFDDIDEMLQGSSKSLRALKKMYGGKVEDENDSSATQDGILSNEDFQRIKELKAKKEARNAFSQQGFKLPTSDQLSSKRVDATKLEANIRKKLTKEQKKELMKASREERGTYQARAAVKQKKTGGQSNKEKERKKFMPIVAKRSKVARSKEGKRKMQRRASKQFRGRKAWK